ASCWCIAYWHSVDLDNLVSGSSGGHLTHTPRRRFEQREQAAITGPIDDPRAENDPGPLPLPLDRLLSFSLGDAVPGHRPSDVPFAYLSPVACGPGRRLARHEDDEGVGRPLVRGSEQAYRCKNVPLPVVVKRPRPDE